MVSYAMRMSLDAALRHLIFLCLAMHVSYATNISKAALNDVQSLPSMSEPPEIISTCGNTCATQGAQTSKRSLTFMLADLHSQAASIEQLRLLDTDTRRALSRPEPSNDPAYHIHDLRGDISALADHYLDSHEPLEKDIIVIVFRENTLIDCDAAHRLIAYVKHGQHRLLALMKRKGGAATVADIPKKQLRIVWQRESLDLEIWNVVSSEFSRNVTLGMLYHELF